MKRAAQASGGALGIEQACLIQCIGEGGDDRVHARAIAVHLADAVEIPAGDVGAGVGARFEQGADGDDVCAGQRVVHRRDYRQRRRDRLGDGGRRKQGRGEQGEGDERGAVDHGREHGSASDAVKRGDVLAWHRKTIPRF